MALKITNGGYQWRWIAVGLLVAVMSMLHLPLTAQKYLSEESFVHFFSDAPLEDIEADNTAGRSVFDAETGRFAFTIPIDQFQFEKSLMQEHFNENYLESEKYPEATFSATIQNWDGATGKQQVAVDGELTIHGVTRDVTVEGEISFTSDGVDIEAVFPVQLKDYKIKIPKAVFYNIAEEVEVTVKFSYKPYETK